MTSWLLEGTVVVSWDLIETHTASCEILGQMYFETVSLVPILVTSPRNWDIQFTV